MAQARKTADKPYNSPAREKRLEKLKEYIAAVPEGAYLLKLAKQKRIPIIFDKRVAMIDAAAVIVAPHTIRSRNKQCEILVNPELSDSSVVIALCHELRHMWQYLQLKKPELTTTLSFQDGISFTRIIEGDAHVFENYMAQKINQATGTRLDHKKFVTTPSGKRETADWSKPAHQKYLFRQFQKSSEGEYHDATLLNQFNTVAKKLPKKTHHVLAKIATEGLAKIDHAGDTNKIVASNILSKKSTPYLPHKHDKKFHRTLVSPTKRKRLDNKLLVNLKK